MKTRKKLKQAIAMLLATGMVVTGLPTGGLEAKANVLTDNLSLLETNSKLNTVNNYTYGSSDSTAFVFGNATNTREASFTNTTFNLAAVLKESDRANNTRGYLSGSGNVAPSGVPSGSQLHTGFSDMWWLGYYAFGKPQYIAKGDGSGSGDFRLYENTSPLDPNVTAWTGAQPITASGGGTGNILHPNTTAQDGKVKLIDVPGSTTGEKIELRQEIKPSDDGQYILVQYTAHNTSTSRTIDFMVGHEADTELGGLDAVPIFITTHGKTGATFEGLHFHNSGYSGSGSSVNESSTAKSFSVFDIISTKEGLAGMDRRDNSDPSENRVRAGVWSSEAGVHHKNWVYSQSKPGFINPGDSAAAFSAYFNLEPNETKTSTFALAIKPQVYYVAPSLNFTKDTSPAPGLTYKFTAGFMGTPINSIQGAIDKMATLTNHGATIAKGYIYLQEDVELDAPVQIPAGLDITIQSADFEKINSSVNYNAQSTWTEDAATPNSTTFKIKRKAGYDGALFEVKSDAIPSSNVANASSRLNFLNVVIDGQSIEAKSPMIVANTGTVIVKQGTTIENAVINDSTNPKKPSVISVSGNAVLSLDAKGDTSAKVEIKNNKSNLLGSAISIDDAATATHPIRLNGNIQITDNNLYNGTLIVTPPDPSITPAPKKANVYLGKKHFWVEAENSFSGKIGLSINSDNLPTTNEMGTPIVNFEGNAVSSTAVPPYSAANFSNDVDGQSIQQGVASGPIKPGTALMSEANQQDNMVYLRTTQYSLSIVYMDETDSIITFSKLNFGTIPANEHVPSNPYSTTLAGGSTLNFKMPTVNGYIYDTTNPNPLPTGISIDSTGNITGTLPSGNTDITVKLKKNEVRYKFDAQGGLPVQDKFEGVTSGSSTLGKVPTPTKIGYDFVKWNSYVDTNNSGGFDTGDTDNGLFAAKDANFPAPAVAKTVLLYAVWTPGSTQYPIQTTHRNTNVALPLTLGMDTSAHIIATSVTKNPVTIPGYRYNTASRTPVQYGTLNTTNGNFTVTMPAVGINLNYGYSVDPSTTFTYTVKHQDAGGNDLKAPVVSQRRAEQDINAMPETSIVGYTYDTFAITEGYNSDNATDSGHYIVGLDNDTLMITNDTASGTFQAKMPNQNVTVVYKYNAESGTNLVRRFYDRITDKIVATQVDQILAGGNINVGIPTAGSTTGDKLYGYAWDLNSSAVVVPPTAATVNPTNGQLTGTMPLVGNGVRADYKLSRDASKWRDINFAVANAPYEKGSINPLPAGSPTSFLANDGSAAGAASAFKFNKLKADGYIPTLTANRYYMFEGWYKDAAATQPVSDTDTFETSTTPLTLYAKFVEDPSQWVDINFVAGSNGSIGTPNTLHKPYDYTWGQILTELPSTTPVANYVFSNWTAPDKSVMVATSSLTNGATYTANFSKDPNTWGTGVGAIEPVGRIGSDGSGEISIHGTTPNNVYVVTDKNGKIVAVVRGKDGGSITDVTNMIPGAHYDVYEGTPDTQAQVGNDASTITGSAVSAPKDVYIPTVENNYNVGYDPNNDGMAQIVINPADPDADYALIDEAGNVLKYPGSDNGWMTPIGSNPSTVTFDNLNPNETYTVVARKKKDSSLPDPLMKIADGNKITANPGDMADAVKYTVETINGSIVSVGDVAVNADSYAEAKANQEVKISAPAVNAQGKRFLHWNVLAGRAVGVSGNITEADYSFKLSNSNIVLKAVYEPVKVAGDDADVTEEIRGGDVGEFGLDPRIIPDLAHELTTPLDRSLIGINGAKVDYRVVFNKRDSKQVEKSAVKPLSESGRLHEDAFTAAYSLDILLERYVDGRKVDRATSSNAEVDVIAQLPARDVDQLDYQIYDVTPDRVTGAINPTEVNISTDVANNAGLLKFKGNVTHTYILVYSKTFKTVFVDNKPVLDHLFLNDTSRNFYHSFKVRRKEAVEDSYYTADYNIVTAYAKNDVAGSIKTPFEDIYGVEYNYVNWSTKEDTLKVYDTTSPVTRRTVIYAYYRNNRPEVLKARDDLGNTIEEARNLIRDPYLKLKEVDEVKAQIDIAVEVLRQARDLVNVYEPHNTYTRQANYDELQRAINALRALIDKYNRLIEERKARRIATTGGETSGGTTSSGRGSKLLAPGEKSTAKGARLEASNVRAFVLGTDGKWTKNPTTGGWSFTLEGGLPLNNIWGMISYQDSTGKTVSRWYFFNSDSTMVTGWHFDTSSNKWFYLNPKAGDEIGQMQTGWVYDNNKWYFMNLESGTLSQGWVAAPDNRWYLFDESGAMLTGWRNVNEKWYYLNPNTNNDRPFGSMYINETTPDGYRVDANGAWIQ